MAKNKHTPTGSDSAVVNAADLLNSTNDKQTHFEGAEVVEVVDQTEKPAEQEQEQEQEAQETQESQTPVFASQGMQDSQETTADKSDVAPEEVKEIIPAIVVDTGTPTTATARAKGFVNHNNPEEQVAKAQAGNIVRQPLKSRILAAQEEARAASASLSTALQKTLAQVPPSYQSEIIRIRQYCEAMAPGRSISETAGAQQQVALYRSIQTIINRQGDYFQPLFTALLKIFASEANGALADTQRNRFDSHIALSREDRKAFRNLTHLLSAVADPKSRAFVLKTINLEAALETGLTEEGRNRVIGYLS